MELDMGQGGRGTHTSSNLSLPANPQSPHYPYLAGVTGGILQDCQARNFQWPFSRRQTAR